MFNRMEAIMSTASITHTQRTEQWRAHIAQQAGSGKSVAAFCREQGIATQTFYWWRSQLTRQEAGAAPRLAAAIPFLDLGAMPAATQGDGSLSIRLDLPGGITLTIARS
jgi:transposase-like protein